MGLEFAGRIFGTGGSGTCDYPSANDVRNGTIFGFGSLTGNLVLPPVDDVLLGIQYGALGTEFTGTLDTGLHFPPPTGNWPIQAASYEQILDAVQIQLIKYTGLDALRVREWYSDKRPMFGDDPLVTFRPLDEMPFQNAGAGRIGTKCEFRIRATIWYRYQSDDAGQHKLWGRQVLALRRAVVDALHDHNVYDGYDVVTGDPLPTALPLLYKVFQYQPSDTFGKEPVLTDGRSDMDFLAGAVLMLHTPRLSS